MGRNTAGVHVSEASTDKPSGISTSGAISWHKWRPVQGIERFQITEMDQPSPLSATINGVYYAAGNQRIVRHTPGCSIRHR